MELPVSFFQIFFIEKLHLLRRIRTGTEIVNFSLLSLHMSLNTA